MTPAASISTAPIIDVSHNGMGDVVVACWIVHSAQAAGRQVLINPHNRREVALLLGVPETALTTAEDPEHSAAAGLGKLEFGQADTSPVSRFDSWCRSLELPPIAPVRPPYVEWSHDGEWAEQQWRTVDPEGCRPRILLFPEAAWGTRMWPRAYFIDTANELAARGYAVAAMAGSKGAVDQMPCHWWGGYSVRQAAAMCKRARLVVANESGPAHLGAAVGTPTIAICGPTEPAIVFAHEPNVRPIRIDGVSMPCVGCHFSMRRGYRHACDSSGCQALMRFDPATAVEQIVRVMARLDN